MNEFRNCGGRTPGTGGKAVRPRHHDAQQGTQTTCRKQVKPLCDTLEDMGNPSMEASSDLLVLGTQDVVDKEIIERVKHIKRVENEQYSDFVKCGISASLLPV